MSTEQVAQLMAEVERVYAGTPLADVMHDAMSDIWWTECLEMATRIPDPDFLRPWAEQMEALR